MPGVAKALPAFARLRPGGRCNVPTTLFDNTADTKSARAPAWVYLELMDVHGLTRKEANRLTLRPAFARLWRERRKCPTFDPRARKRGAEDLAARLRQELSAEFVSTPALVDLCAEALALLDSPEVERVAAGLANLLQEVAA